MVRIENQALARCQQIRNKIANDTEWCTMKLKPSPIVKEMEVVNGGNILKMFRLINRVHSQS